MLSSILRLSTRIYVGKARTVGFLVYFTQYYGLTRSVIRPLTELTDIICQILGSCTMITSNSGTSRNYGHQIDELRIQLGRAEKSLKLIREETMVC